MRTARLIRFEPQDVLESQTHSPTPPPSQRTTPWHAMPPAHGSALASSKLTRIPRPPNQPLAAHNPVPPPASRPVSSSPPPRRYTAPTSTIPPGHAQPLEPGIGMQDHSVADLPSGTRAPSRAWGDVGSGVEGGGGGGGGPAR